MHWKNLINGVKRLFLISVSMATVFGCSTGVEPRMASDLQPEYINSSANQSHSSLRQQGEFTRAALLKGIYDSSMFEVTPSPQETIPTSITVPSHLDKQNSRLSTNPKSHSVAPAHIRTAYSLKQAVPSNPVDGEWHANLGWSLLIQGNYAGSAAAYREALRHDPSLAQAYLGLGMALNMIDDVPSAIKAYEQALELRPNYAAAQVNLGYIYADGQQQEQDLKKAKQLFQKASQQGDPFATIALLELRSR